MLYTFIVISPVLFCRWYQGFIYFSCFDNLPINATFKHFDTQNVLVYIIQKEYQACHDSKTFAGFYDRATSQTNSLVFASQNLQHWCIWQWQNSLGHGNSICRHWSLWTLSQVNGLVPKIWNTANLFSIGPSEQGSVNRESKHKGQWIVNQNTIIFIHEHAFESIV